MDYTNIIARITRVRNEARKSTQEDPEVALMLARKAAEAICKEILLNTGNSISKDPTLESLVEQLISSELIPKDVATHLKTIQLHGNFGSHGQDKGNEELTPDYIQSCIKSLDEVCDWFFKRFVPRLLLSPPVTVLDLAEYLEIRPFAVIHNLMDLNIFATMSHVLDDAVIDEILERHGKKRIR